MTFLLTSQLNLHYLQSARLEMVNNKNMMQHGGDYADPQAYLAKQNRPTATIPSVVYGA